MKKILAVLLVISLVIFSFAACGSKQTEGDAVIKIAVAGPMTGDNAEYGIGFANAAKLMAKEWNEKGGVDVGGTKYRVEIVG